MTITTLTQDEVYTYLNVPFNPPVIGESLTEEGFFDEWHEVRDGLEVVLDRFGENDAYGQGDYYLGNHAMLSRGIGVEITSAKPLTEVLIPAIRAYVAGLDERYEIGLCLLTEEGYAHVFVNQDEVKVCCPASIPELLGIRG